MHKLPVARCKQDKLPSKNKLKVEILERSEIDCAVIIPHRERYRVYASISFALILLVIGVPLWWHTTAVPRVALPYSGIAELSNLNIKILCKINIVGSSRSRLELLTSEISQEFKYSELYKIDVNYKVISGNIINSAFTLQDHEKIASVYHTKVGEILLLEAPNLGGVLVGTNRSIFFPTETSGPKLSQILSQWLLRDKSLALTRNALTEPTKYTLDEENRRRFPASPAYDVLLTVINPDPGKLKVNWNLPESAEDYLEPFLDHVALVANFSVKSQWLYLMPLDVRPKQVPDSTLLGRHYALSEDVLPQLITPLEKKIGNEVFAPFPRYYNVQNHCSTFLASQVSLHPCINLVTYMVPCENAPIHIYTRNGRRSKSLYNIEAFLSPRWGGVVISNPDNELCLKTNENEPVEFTPNAETIIGVFLSQLRLLLGIPEPEDTISGAQVTPLVGLKPREWELDALLRVRSIEQLTSAKLTLQSLAQLLEEISNIVINDNVGSRINRALELVQVSASKLKNGDLTEGFLLSKDAFVTAETAFTDPSLLALLYFPEDQKYAVYIPLFLPVMIPVLLSLKKIKRYFFPGKEKVE